MILHGYEVDDSKWEQKSGNGVCNIGIKNGKKYFIKKITSHKFPLNPDSKAKKMTLEESNAWLKERIQIMNSLPGDGMGTIVKPIEYIRNETFCYEVAHFIETDSINAEDVYSLPLEEKISVMLTVASCLNQLHNAGIIHADLDPSNILISRAAGGRHVTKLIDFTDCFFTNNIPQSIMSKEQWQSPELNIYSQYSEADENPALPLISTKTDVFTLGLIFYTYCSKEGLRKDEYPSVTVARGENIVKDKSIDENIATLINSMLKLDPNERPTMAEVHKVLLAMKNKRPITSVRQEIQTKPDHVDRKRITPEEPKPILEKKNEITQKRAEEKEKLEAFMKKKEQEAKNITLSPGDGYSASGHKVKSVAFNKNNKSKVDIEFDDGSKKIMDLPFAIHLKYVKANNQ